MATLAEINRRIEKLQRQAEALRERDKKGVIADIRAAIEDYGITAADLGFGAGGETVAPRKRRGRPPAAGRITPGRRATGPAPVRYRDEAGNTWTGRGKRPNWFKAALAAGKTTEDLLVQPDDPTPAADA